jgi:hypothetical protein
MASRSDLERPVPSRFRLPPYAVRLFDVALATLIFTALS